MSALVTATANEVWIMVGSRFCKAVGDRQRRHRRIVRIAIPKFLGGAPQLRGGVAVVHQDQARAGEWPAGQAIGQRDGTPHLGL